MNEYVIYTGLAIIIALTLFILSYVKVKNHVLIEEALQEEETPEEVAAPVRPRQLPNVVARDGGPRNRAMANRNARARMRVAEAQRQQQLSDEEEEENIEELGEEIALPDGKIGKKKLAKLQMKAEKRAMREAEEREREEKKERDEQKEEMRVQKEKEKEDEEARVEEEERIRREEQEKKEQEEYDQMKAEFEVEEEGFEEEDDEGSQTDLLKQFLDYIKRNKVVVLEDLAALFKLKTQAVIDRITELQKEGTLTGVIDDRGKFIYISQGELESVGKFIKQRGRVSISDLAEASNTLINLNPETSVEA